MSSSPSHTRAKGKIYLSACLPASWDFWIDEEACLPLSTEEPMQLVGEPASMHLPKKERKKTSQQIADENVIMPFEEEIVKMHVEGIHTNTCMPCLWYANFIGQLGLPCHLPVLLAPTTQIPCQLCHMSRRNVLWQTSRNISTSHCHYLKESTLQSSDNPTDLGGIFFTFGKWHIHKFGDRAKVWDHHTTNVFQFFLHRPALLLNCTQFSIALRTKPDNSIVHQDLMLQNLHQISITTRNLLCRRR